MVKVKQLPIPRRYDNIKYFDTVIRFYKAIIKMLDNA